MGELRLDVNKIGSSGATRQCRQIYWAGSIIVMNWSPPATPKSAISASKSAYRVLAGEKE
jgi:hypothetical protein